MTCFSGSQSWHIWMGTHSYVPWLSKKWNDVHDMQWRTWHACTWHEMKWRTWHAKKWNDVHDMQWRTWHACTWHEMKWRTWHDVHEMTYMTWRTWNDVHDMKWRTWHAKKRNDVQDMLFWTPTSIQVHGRQNGGPRARSRHLNKCEHSSKVWMRHVSRICISPVTRRSQSWHIWMGYWYTLMNEWMNECMNAAHVYTGRKVWMSHVSHMHQSCHT